MESVKQVVMTQDLACAITEAMNLEGHSPGTLAWPRGKSRTPSLHRGGGTEERARTTTSTSASASPLAPALWPHLSLEQILAAAAPPAAPKNAPPARAAVPAALTVPRAAAAQGYRTSVAAMPDAGGEPAPRCTQSCDYDSALKIFFHTSLTPLLHSCFYGICE